MSIRYKIYRFLDRGWWWCTSSISGDVTVTGNVTANTLLQHQMKIKNVTGTVSSATNKLASFKRSVI